MNSINPPDFTSQSLSSDNIDDDSDTILGMKVIRIARGDWTPFKAAKFLKEQFPCARFLVNFRSDVQAQVESFHSNFHWNVSDDFMKDQNKFLTKLYGNLKDRARMIDISIWKNNVTVLNEIVDWLGFENCAFSSIFHENQDGYRRDKKTSMDLGNQCTYPH